MIDILWEHQQYPKTEFRSHVNIRVCYFNTSLLVDSRSVQSPWCHVSIVLDYSKIVLALYVTPRKSSVMAHCHSTVHTTQPPPPRFQIPIDLKQEYRTGSSLPNNTTKSSFQLYIWVDREVYILPRRLTISSLQHVEFDGVPVTISLESVLETLVLETKYGPRGVLDAQP